MKAPKRGRRGAVILFVLVVLSAMVAVIAAGQDARIRELGMEERPRCRLQARLAAESAIGRALARLSAGKPPSFSPGHLGDGVEYTIAATKSSQGWALVGTGRCQRRGGGEATRSIRAEAAQSNGRWRIARWQE